MILGFTTRNPVTKQDTCFEELILNNSKIHTLRKGYRWKPGMVIHMATGVRTKNYRQFNADRADLWVCKGVQKIEFFSIKNPFKKLGLRNVYKIFVDKRELHLDEMISLSRNDGFSCLADMLAWFEYENEFPDQIVHWTDKRY